MIFLHVIISLVGIATGLVVLYGLMTGKRMNSWTAWFLGANIATSVSGYAIPADRLLPSHIVGALALLALLGATIARYAFRMSGTWRATYIVTASTAVYLNVFVAVVQAFRKVPALKALAPTETEAPFAIAQAVALAAFVVLTILALRNFHDTERPMSLAATAGR